MHFAYLHITTTLRNSPKKFCHYSDKEHSALKRVYREAHTRNSFNTALIQYYNRIQLGAERMTVDQSYRGQSSDLTKPNTDAWFCPACVMFDEN